ncbi:hypothetical protein [Nonlabens xiamenensis]|uniref:hypothetical protein n=1 Tax=Nonlabens xiamenensis TaxID=2341043 RepID=UPI000F6064B6|nr:hypothetical protein [Nonlabens xiamenensis]
MKKYLLLFGLCCCVWGIAQKPSVELRADAFYGVDDFDALYYGKDNVFYKKQADQRLQFYDVQLGDLTEVDLINPLKILLFYKDTQTVVLVDNRLNETQRIILNELEPYRFFEHARLAGERRLWLHDLDQNRIQLYDYIQERVVVNTPVLKNDVQNLLTDYNFCHVWSDGYLQTFNTYGSETASLELDQPKHLGYDFGTLVGKNNDGFHLWKLNEDYRFDSMALGPALNSLGNSDLNSANQADQDLQNPIKSLYLKGGKLYLWRGKRVLVYDLNLNKK